MFLCVVELTFKHLSFTHTQNGFKVPFHVTQAETDRRLVWWKRRLSWTSSCFQIHRYNCFEGLKKVQIKIFFVWPYTFFSRTVLPDPIHQGTGSFCSSFLRTWTHYGCLETFEMSETPSLYHLPYGNTAYTGAFFNLCRLQVVTKIIFLWAD